MIRAKIIRRPLREAISRGFSDNNSSSAARNGRIFENYSHLNCRLRNAPVSAANEPSIVIKKPHCPLYAVQTLWGAL